MTRASLLLLAAASASSVAPAAAQSEAEKLARHSMSIARINSIYTSEVSDDFGNDEELWAVNTVWQWEGILKDDELDSELKYHSYLACYNQTGMSGNKRRGELASMFQDYEDEIYLSDTSVINDYEERSCYLVSAVLDVLSQVLNTQPDELTRYLEVQPAGPSMKMLQGFYQAIHNRIMGEDVKAPTNEGNVVITQDEEVGIDVTYCPVIKALIDDPDLPDVTYETLRDEVVEFVTADSGKQVKERDFFYSNYKTTPNPPERMKTWHDVVERVTSLTDDSGYNECLNGTIQGRMAVEESSTDTAFITIPDAEKEGTDDEDCIFYLVRALSNHPYICRMDLRGETVPLAPAPTPAPQQEEEELSTRMPTRSETLPPATGAPTAPPTMGTPTAAPVVATTEAPSAASSLAVAVKANLLALSAAFAALAGVCIE